MRLEFTRETRTMASFVFKWEDKYYCYVRLPFGSRSSPKKFTFLSEAIHWIVTQNYGIKNLLFLLDDFLAIDHKEGDGAKTKQILLSVFHKLGVTLNDRKKQRDPQRSCNIWA